MGAAYLAAVQSRGPSNDRLAARILWGMGAGVGLGLVLRLGGALGPGTGRAAAWLAEEVEGQGAM